MYMGEYPDPRTPSTNIVLGPGRAISTVEMPHMSVHGGIDLTEFNSIELIE